jgi:hypothetical protein
MKTMLAPVGSGVAVAALLYGLLCAAERRLPEPEDPWLVAFVADGLKAEFRSLSPEPQNSLMANDLRPLFETPAYAGTQVRNYLVQNVSVQVVRLPGPGLLPEVTEGRKFDQKYKQGGNPVHVCRMGRSVLFAGAFGKAIPLFGQMKAPRKDTDAIFDAFEETARRYP